MIIFGILVIAVVIDIYVRISNNHTDTLRALTVADAHLGAIYKRLDDLEN